MGQHIHGAEGRQHKMQRRLGLEREQPWYAADGRCFEFVRGKATERQGNTITAHQKSHNLPWALAAKCSTVAVSPDRHRHCGICDRYN
jgi:hypothetical protein